MEFNPKKIVKKIVYLLIVVLCLFSIGTVLFVTLIDLEVLYKVIFLSFSLLVAVIILTMVKRLYKQVDSQFQELTLIHDISTSLNLSLDHNVLYRVNLYSIIERLNFDSGVIIGLDSRENELVVKYSVGLLDKYEKELPRLKLPVNEYHNIISFAMSEKEIIYIKQNQSENKYNERKYKVNLKELFGFKNYLIVPLMNIDKCVGTLILNSTKSKEDISHYLNIIVTASNYIASSIYNLMLYEKLKKKLMENKKLNELAQKFNSELNLNKLFSLTIEATVQMIEGERGNIFLYEKESDALVIKASASHTPLNPNIRFKPGEGIVGMVYSTGKAYIVNDTTNDPYFKDRPDSPRKIKSLLEVPIKTQDKIIGVLSIDNKKGGFDDNDKELLSTLSSHIGIAIENATLHKELRNYNQNLERIVKERTSQLNKANNVLEKQNKLLQIRNQIIENDLLMARSVQQRILPEKEPTHKKLKIAARYIPMEKVGGDFYDFFLIEKGKNLGFIISDVSGHGTAAALITAMLKIACKSLPNYILEHPHLFMRTANERIMGYTSSNFITAFYSYFDMQANKLSYCCAGHTHPILLRKEENTLYELYTKGRVLGFMDNVKFEMKEFELKKGDRIVFYTDGLSECFNQEEEMYSVERIREMLVKTANHEVDKVAELIYLDMLNWVKDPSKINDDVAFVIFDFLG